MQHQGKYLGRRCWLSLMDTLGLATTFSSALLVRMTWIDQVYFISIFSMQMQCVISHWHHKPYEYPESGYTKKLPFWPWEFTNGPTSLKILLGDLILFFKVTFNVIVTLNVTVVAFMFPEHWVLICELWWDVQHPQFSTCSSVIAIAMGDDILFLRPLS